MGFDLDDTLHCFKLASGEASQSIFSYISQRTKKTQPQIATDYRDILSRMQHTHFTENKPSIEYRRGRFEELLKQNGLDIMTHIDDVLNLYDSTLANNLTSKYGAKEVLQAAKKAGKTVAIISEGPHDAQELTLKRLGLSPYIDQLITSSAYGQSKTDGLFQTSLDVLGCSPKEMLFIGDNPIRDYDAALEIGIHTLLLDEDNKTDDTRTKIRNLLEIKDIFFTSSPNITQEIHSPEAK